MFSRWIDRRKKNSSSFLVKYGQRSIIMTWLVIVIWSWSTNWRRSTNLYRNNIILVIHRVIICLILNIHTTTNVFLFIKREIIVIIIIVIGCHLLIRLVLIVRVLYKTLRKTSSSYITPYRSYQNYKIRLIKK